MDLDPERMVLYPLTYTPETLLLKENFCMLLITNSEIDL